MAITNKTKPEPTTWRIPDDVWEIVAGILECRYPKHAQDRKRVPLRPVLDGILYRRRTGCQWNQLPKEFGDDSTVHRHFQAWCALGIFDDIWHELLLRCEALDGIQWEWQSADASMGKAMGKSKMPQDAVGRTPQTGEKRGETEHRGRWRWWSLGCRNRRSQRPRHQTPRRHAGGHGAISASSPAGPSAASLLG